jgi:hypothetical protein
LEAGKIAPPSSSLIIVGREDTGELEAQIRGSRHAWDMRLISADALIKLVQLKENAEGPETGRKIRSLLVPREYTRLDEMVDVMFTTAKDVERVIEAVASEQEQAAEVDNAPEKAKGAWEFTDSKILQAKRDEIIRALSSREGVPLIKKSRALIGVQITGKGRPLQYQSTMQEGVVPIIGMHTTRNGRSFSMQESADI